MGDDKVLHGVVGPSRPRQEVVDGGTGQRLGTVEAGSLLEIAETAAQARRDHNAFGAEEVVV
jgi:hypothetical protein